MGKLEDKILSLEKSRDNARRERDEALALAKSAKSEARALSKVDRGALVLRSVETRAGGVGAGVLGAMDAGVDAFGVRIPAALFAGMAGEIAGIAAKNEHIHAIGAGMSAGGMALAVKDLPSRLFGGKV